QQHRHRAVAVVRRGDVGPAILVEVPHHGRDRIAARLVGRHRDEGAVAVVQEHPQPVAVVVRHHQVDLAVAVEVGGVEVVAIAHGVGHGGGEGAAAQVAQDGQGGAAVVDDGQVGPGAAVD